MFIFRILIIVIDVFLIIIPSFLQSTPLSGCITTFIYVLSLSVSIFLQFFISSMYPFFLVLTSFNFASVIFHLLRLRDILLQSCIYLIFVVLSLSKSGFTSYFQFTNNILNFLVHHN